MVRGYGLASLALVYGGIFLLLIRVKGTRDRSISGHSVENRLTYYLMALMQMIALPLFCYFSFQWFVPYFELSPIFGVCAIFSATGFIVAALLPENKYIKIHNMAAFLASGMMLPMLIIMILSPVVEFRLRFFLIGALVMMLYVVAVLVIKPRYFRAQHLFFQLAYMLSFHLSVILMSYWGSEQHIGFMSLVLAIAVINYTHTYLIVSGRHKPELTISEQAARSDRSHMVYFISHAIGGVLFIIFASVFLNGLADMRLYVLVLTGVLTELAQAILPARQRFERYHLVAAYIMSALVTGLGLSVTLIYMTGTVRALSLLITFLILCGYPAAMLLKPHYFWKIEMLNINLFYLQMLMLVYLRLGS